MNAKLRIICKFCNLEKDESEFLKFSSYLGRESLCKRCKTCRLEQARENKRKYIEKIGPDNWKKISRQRYYNNIETHKKATAKWVSNNKERFLSKRSEWNKNKRKNDPIFKIRSHIHSVISSSILNIDKNYKSASKYLSFSFDDLKSHLESQFDPWMNWENHGSYKLKDWDDNDNSTWKWNIDHIIPHSEFNYSSVEDDSFKRCWSLENLRPLSAKQNVLDGITRARHKNDKGQK